jgi:hypothetical protein
VKTPLLLNEVILHQRFLIHIHNQEFRLKHPVIVAPVVQVGCLVTVTTYGCWFRDSLRSKGNVQVWYY